eukprot:375734-Prymnesium_polylepis.2
MGAGLGVAQGVGLVCPILKPILGRRVSVGCAQVGPAPTDGENKTDKTAVAGGNGTGSAALVERADTASPESPANPKAPSNRLGEGEHQLTAPEGADESVRNRERSGAICRTSGEAFMRGMGGILTEPGRRNSLTSRRGSADRRGSWSAGRRGSTGRRGSAELQCSNDEGAKASEDGVFTPLTTVTLFCGTLLQRCGLLGSRTSNAAAKAAANRAENQGWSNRRVGRLKEGDSYGEAGLLGPELPARESLVAMEHTRVYWLDRGDYERILEEFGASELASFTMRMVLEQSTSDSVHTLALFMISRVPIFAEASTELMWELASRIELFNCVEDEDVIRIGDPARGLFLMLTGECHVYIIEEDSPSSARMSTRRGSVQGSAQRLAEMCKRASTEQAGTSSGFAAAAAELAGGDNGAGTLNDQGDGEHGTEGSTPRESKQRCSLQAMGTNKKLVKILKSGDHFGELSLLDRDSAARATVKAARDTRLAMLDPSSFDRVCEAFPSLRDLIGANSPEYGKYNFFFRLPPLRDSPIECVQRIATAAKHERHAAGTTLQEANTKCRGIFFLIDGSLTVRTAGSEAIGDSYEHAWVLDEGDVLRRGGTDGGRAGQGGHLRSKRLRGLLDIGESRPEAGGRV